MEAGRKTRKEKKKYFADLNTRDLRSRTTDEWLFFAGFDMFS